MRIAWLRTIAALSLRELARNRMVAILLLVVPTLFFALVILTTPEQPVRFRLAAVADDAFVDAPQRHQSLVFIGQACMGLLCAFVAMNIARRERETYRRLVLCGYRPTEILAGKALALLVVAVAVATYVTALLTLVVDVAHWPIVLAGNLLGGGVYGAYGLLIGALVRRELEAILLVVLLVNIDAGWLQNPVYYASAENTAIIRALPAYLPSQVALVGAFTDHGAWRAAVGAATYAAALLAAAALAYGWRLRVRRAAPGGSR